MSHSPAPWQPFDLEGKPVNDPSVFAGKHCIATVWINDLSRKEAVANARLMAASPRLLAALQDTLRMLQAAHMQLGMDHKGNKRVIAARVALAEAVGDAK